MGPYASSNNSSDFVCRVDALALLQLVLDHDQKGISGVFAWPGQYLAVLGNFNDGRRDF